MLLDQLRMIRRPLLTLAILFLTITLLEVNLGHRLALTHHAWLALVPVVWLPISLLALMAVQLAPSPATALFAQVVMVIAAAVGMAGSGLHMMAAGVDLAHVGRVFSSTVWGGSVSPNWPVAIAVAGFLGFMGSFGADRGGETLPRDAAGAATALAFGLIVAGIGLSAVSSMVMVSSICFLLAAFLLLAALIGMLANAAMQRSNP